MLTINQFQKPKIIYLIFEKPLNITCELKLMANKLFVKLLKFTVYVNKSPTRGLHSISVVFFKRYKNIPFQQFDTSPKRGSRCSIYTI